MNLQQSLVLVYMLVAVNFMFARLKDFSCNVSALVTGNMAVKHGLNLVATFFVLVLLTKSTPPIHPLLLVGLTVAMYAFFMLITRCDYRFLAAFVVLTTVVFYIEASKMYAVKTKRADETEEGVQTKFTRAQVALQVLSFACVLLGTLVYIGQHTREYSRDWSWYKFWVGKPACAGNGTFDASLGVNLVDGLARLFKVGVK